MENFKKTLQRRIALTALYCGLTALFLVLGNLLGRRFQASDFAVGFATGAFTGIELVMVYYMSKYLGALKDESKLKALYIEETDERTRYIQSKIGGVGINVILGGLGLATVVSGFLNQTVFLTLMAALIFALLVKGALKLYYFKKV